MYSRISSINRSRCSSSERASTRTQDGQAQKRPHTETNQCLTTPVPAMHIIPKDGGPTAFLAFQVVVQPETTTTTSGDRRGCPLLFREGVQAVVLKACVLAILDIVEAGGIGSACLPRGVITGTASSAMSRNAVRIVSPARSFQQSQNRSCSSSRTLHLP